MMVIQDVAEYITIPGLANCRIPIDIPAPVASSVWAGPENVSIQLAGGICQILDAGGVVAYTGSYCRFPN